MNKTILHWSYLNFKDVPMDLFLYEDLEEVYLKENYITVIPKWLLNITTLKFIHLAGNNLSELPADIYMLENLEFLDVSNNELIQLPNTIGLMLRLQQLNVSGNHLTELPADIGSLRRLEHLNISKNQISRLPVQLSECMLLNELNISDNEQLWHIPERISNLPALQSFSADRCALIYLPAALSKFINHMRIFHNPTLTHIPMIYERFYRNFYESRQKPTKMIVYHSKLFWVEELETHTLLLLPIGTRKIYHVPSTECQVTLYDKSLHALQYFHRFEPIYENVMLHTDLPESYMSSDINNGPIARCTIKECSNPLYTTYYFMVVKRQGSSSKQIFTCNFCTNYCGLRWLSNNHNKYYQVDWRIYDE